MQCRKIITKQSSINYSNHRKQNKTKQVRHIIVKLLILQMRQKNTLLDDGDNDDWKKILMGILNVLLLGLTLCIYSFSVLKN